MRPALPAALFAVAVLVTASACYRYSLVASPALPPPPEKTFRIRFTTPRELDLRFEGSSPQRLRFSGGVIGNVTGVRGDTLELRVLSVLDATGHETALSSGTPARAEIVRDNSILLEERKDRSLPIFLLVIGLAIAAVVALSTGGLGGGNPPPPPPPA